MRPSVAAALAVLALVVLLVVADPEGVDSVISTVTGGRAGFLATLGGEVARQLEELRPDLSDAERLEAAAIVAAQGAHETGYGKAIAWRLGFNFGNITAGSNWTGDVVNGGDVEFTADGNARAITQRFRKYPDLPSAVSDFFAVLSWPRYAAALDALVAGDVSGYVSALHAGGYFTASSASYLAGLGAALPSARKAIA